MNQKTDMAVSCVPFGMDGDWLKRVTTNLLGLNSQSTKRKNDILMNIYSQSATTHD